MTLKLSEFQWEYWWLPHCILLRDCLIFPPQNRQFRELRAQKELDAHISRFRSTYEYYQTWGDEHLTRPYVRETVDYIFRLRINLFNKPIETCWEQHIDKKTSKFQPTSGSPTSTVRKSYPKSDEIWHPAGREILDYIFYRNRSCSDTSPYSFFSGPSRVS